MEQIFPSQTDTPASESRPNKGGAAGPSKFQANIIIALLCLGFILSIWSALKPTPKWEYRIVAVPDITFKIGIAELGDDGWELVTARRASSGEGKSTEFSYEMVFKRPKRW